MTKTGIRLDWWRILQWPLFLASATVAAWVSYTQQRQLGIYVGWDSPWGLPVILDGLAAATLLSYIRKPGAFNRAVSSLVVATAVVGNAQAAIYDPDTTDLPAPLWTVIAWKVLPPVAVFTIAHYIAHERKETKNDAARGGDGPAPDASETAWSAGGVKTDPRRAGTETLKPAGSRTGAAAGGGRDRQSVPRTAGVRGGGVDTGRSRTSGTRAISRPVEELADEILTSGWTQDVSADELAARLHVAKGRALKARRLARAREAAEKRNGQPVSVVGG